MLPAQSIASEGRASARPRFLSRRSNVWDVRKHVPPGSDRDAKHPPAIYLHAPLLETGRAYQLIHLRGGAPAHDPRFAFTVTQHPCDEFELRMPGLVRVDQVTIRLDGPSKPA